MSSFSVQPSAPFPALRRDLVAILRGVTPDEIGAIGMALHDAGIEAIEVPLNSPDPFTSIAKLARLLPGALIGAGTVLTADDVERLHDAGGRLLVSPNIDPDVMAVARRHRMVTMPGVFTATECFAALKAGASGLKVFPASALGIDGVKALMAVLPAGTRVGAVGGVSDGDFAAWGRIGVRTFGLGSSLYKPGMAADEIGRRARAAVTAWDEAFGA